MESPLIKAIIGLTLLPLVYFSTVRLFSQFVIPTDRSSLWATPSPATRYSADRLPLVVELLSRFDPLGTEYRKTLTRGDETADDPGSETVVRDSIWLSAIDPENWVLWGALKTRQGLFEDGLASFEKAVSLDPGRAATYSEAGLRLLGVALCSPEKKSTYKDLAELDLAMAIALDSSLLNDPQLAMAMATIAAGKGDKEQAISYLKRVTLLPPFDWAFAIRKLALSFSLDEPMEALRSWRKMLFVRSLSQEEKSFVETELKKYPVADFAYFLADLNVLEGKLESARRSLSALVAVRPGIADYRLALGTVYEKIGNYREAGICYEKALELSPANQEAKKKVIEHFSGQKPVAGR
jgi:tetratricopeptide (TPR) repeat protein